MLLIDETDEAGFGSLFTGEQILINVSRFKAKEYNGEMENIYAGPTMKALKFLEPDMNRRYSKDELRLMLEEETGN